ncbi:MAG: hypothetical protein ABIQ97_00735 [Lysobacteraceae bacterium]
MFRLRRAFRLGLTDSQHRDQAALRFRGLWREGGLWAVLKHLFTG